MSINLIYGPDAKGISLFLQGDAISAKHDDQEIQNLKIGILGNHPPTDLPEKVNQVGAKNIHALYDEKKPSIRIFTASKLAVPQITRGRKAWKSQNIAKALKFFTEAKELSKKEPEHIDEAVSKTEHRLLNERSGSESHLFLSKKQRKRLKRTLSIYSTLNGILEYLDGLEHHRSYHHFLKALTHEIKKEKFLAANEYLLLAETCAQPARSLARGAALLRKDPILLAQYLERINREHLSEDHQQMIDQKDAIRMSFERHIGAIRTNQKLTCFICYCTREKDVEEWLKRVFEPDLTLAGFATSAAFKNLRHGKFRHNFEEEIRKSDRTLILCTPELKSDRDLNDQVRLSVNRLKDSQKQETIFPIYVKGEENSSLPSYFFEGVIASYLGRFDSYYINTIRLIGSMLQLEHEKVQSLEDSFKSSLEDIMRGDISEDLDTWRSHLKTRVFIPNWSPPQIETKGPAFKVQLCERYQQNREIFEIPLPMSEETFPIEDFFTQLVLIKTELQEKREKPAQNPEGGDRDALLKDHDQMTQFETDPERVEHDSLKEAQRTVEVEQPLEIHELLTKKGDEKDPKKVLIVGRAGVGKTTLINKIISDWVGERAFQEFEMVYRIPLRALNNKKNLSKAKDTSEWLAKAIAFHVLDNAEAVDEIHEHYLSNPSKILLLLDGMDEANAEVLERVGKLLQERDLSIILTSRPGEAVSGNRNNFDRRLENLGFSNQQLEQFVTRFFKNEKIQTEFLAALKKDSNLYSLSHTPLQLQMLCVQWKPGQEGFPSTLTALYTQMIDDLWAWNSEHVNKKRTKIKKSEKEAFFDVLGAVAQQGLKQNKLVISENEIIDQLPGKITLSKLEKTGILKRTGNDYYFLHLTYQEYFIAYRVSRQSLEEQQKFIREHGFQPRYILVMSFLAGIVNAQDSSPTKENTKHLIESLRVELEDLSGAFQMELMLRSFSECDPEPWMNSYVLFQKYRKALERYLIRGEGNSKLKEYIKYIKKPIFIADIYPILIKNLYTHKSIEVLARTLKTLSACKNQTLGPETISALRELLLSSNWYVQKAASGALEKVSKNQVIDPETISALRELLSSSDLDVQIAASNALKEISNNQTLDPKALSALIELLFSSNWDVQRAASTALKEISKNQVVDPETISALIELISSSNWAVQRAASTALGEISKNQVVDPETISALIELISSSNWAVQRAASTALKEISSNQVLDPETISALRELLFSSNSDVQQAASNALKEISKNRTLNPKTISALRELLSSSDLDVQRAASNALGEISKNRTLNPETISALRELLLSSNWDVQRAARTALGEISKNRTLNPKTISALRELLSSSDLDVQRAASNALEKISKNRTLDPETISALRELLFSSNWDVQRAASNALKKISKNRTLDPETISALRELLFSSNWDVQRAASTALREISNNQVLDPETISALIELLFSSNWDVQRAASTALKEISSNQVLDPETISALRELLSSSNWAVQRAASTALKEISSNQVLDPETILALIELLSSSNRNAQRAAITAVGEISKNRVIDPETISALIELLSSSDLDVKRAASTALKEISKNQALPDKLLSRIVKKHLVVLQDFSLCNILNAVCISKSRKAFVVLLDKCFEQGSPLYFKENLLCTIENNKEISGGIPLKEQKKFLRWAKKYSPFGDCFLV